MIDGRLEHTTAVDEVLHGLARPAPPRAAGAAAHRLGGLPGPQLGHLMLLATVGLRPPAVRQRLGLRWTRANELEIGVLARALRAATPLMPAALRNTGPGYLRWRAGALARGDVASAALPQQ